LVGADVLAEEHEGHRSFIAVVGDLAAGAGPEGLTIREVRDRLDERGFGLMILFLAIPCLVPALYGVPQIVGVPILLLAAQVLVGRHEPWLPRRILKRRVSKAWLDRMAEFSAKRMSWFERLSRPRLKLFACGPGERLAALMMIVATLTIVIPFTNTVPSVALTLLAVGLIERDGVFALLGNLVAAAWLGFLLALGAGLFLGATWAVRLFEQMGGQAVADFLGRLF
jgi:hypothetical protein